MLIHSQAKRGMLVSQANLSRKLKHWWWPNPGIKGIRSAEIIILKLTRVYA